MIDDVDCGAIGGTKIDRRNWSTRRKPAPVPLYPPQIPHYLTRARTRVAAVGSQRLTAWAMVLPISNFVVSHLMGTGDSFPGLEWKGVHHSPHLVPRVRIRGAISPFHHTSSWCDSSWSLYFFLASYCPELPSSLALQFHRDLMIPRISPQFCPTRDSTGRQSHVLFASAVPLP
jgi:hypothetical protein